MLVVNTFILKTLMCFGETHPFCHAYTWRPYHSRGFSSKVYSVWTARNQDFWKRQCGHPLLLTRLGLIIQSVSFHDSSRSDHVILLSGRKQTTSALTSSDKSIMDNKLQPLLTVLSLLAVVLWLCSAFDFLFLFFLKMQEANNIADTYI